MTGILPRQRLVQRPESRAERRTLELLDEYSVMSRRKITLYHLVLQQKGLPQSVSIYAGLLQTSQPTLAAFADQTDSMPPSVVHFVVSYWAASHGVLVSSTGRVRSSCCRIIVNRAPF